MIDILFIDGLEARYDKSYCSFLGYLFPLAAMLERNNYCFKILNITFLNDYSIEGIIKELHTIQFKSIGITTTADNYPYVKEVVNKIKSEFPDIPIILGGPQATYNDDFILNDCNCDAIIRHEGDYKLIQLLNYFIKQNGNLNLISGISYKLNNEIFKTKDAGKYIDLDELPTPQFAILRDIKYWYIPNDKTENEALNFLKVIKHINNTIITSRGCPYNCIFCVEGSLTRSYRERNLDLVMKDIEYFLQVTELNHVIIADSTFTSSPLRVKEFCIRIKKLREKYNFHWFAEGRANILAKNLELIDIMHDAGLWNLQIGIESGSTKILEIQNKKITTDEVRLVAQKIGTYNDLILSGHIILGNPGETIDTFKETIEFAKELHILSKFNIDLKFGYLVPYVGTPIRENPNKYGIEILADNFENKKIMGYNNVLCRPVELPLSIVENFYADIGRELNIFYRETIFKLPKKAIDDKMAFFSKFQNGQMTNSFAKTLGSIVTFMKYYSLYGHKAIINDLDYVKAHVNLIYPVRLWNLSFDNKKEAYNFIDFSGQNIEIKNKDKYLWEMASGLNTISEILLFEESPFKNNEEDFNYALDFYIDLHKNYAILFR
jgi:radical SAM superfamily enzyme YgiQ (UPF0313 family)